MKKFKSLLLDSLTVKQLDSSNVQKSDFCFPMRSKVRALLLKGLPGLSFIASFSVLLRPVLDPDLGWHLRMGEFIVRTRSLPWQNLFSYTLPNYRWADSYWLTQVLMVGVKSNVGLFGLSLFFALIATVAIFIAAKGHPLVTFLLSLALAHSAGARPMVVSFLFLAVEVTILRYNDITIRRDNDLKEVQEPRPFPISLYPYIPISLALPLLFLLWSNIHADFVVGLFVLGLYLLLRAIKNRRVSVVDMVILLASTLATFVNPYGLFLWQTLLKEATSLVMHNNIMEWQPGDPAGTSGWTVIGLVSTVLFFIIYERRDWKKKLLDYVPLVFFSLLSIRSFFYIHILALLSAPFLCQKLDQLKQKGRSSNISQTFVFLSVPAFALFVILYSPFSLLNAYQSSHFETSDLVKRVYPREAVEYLKVHPQEGNIFNEYGWGGYLIWHLPEVKTFIDGRMPAWRRDGESVFAEYLKLADRKPGWEGVLQRYDISWALLKKESELVEALTAELGWKEVYGDETAVILRENP